MKPVAHTVLMDLVLEFKMMFHELFMMEVNHFYEEALNKIRGEHPSKVCKVQCWAMVTKLLCIIFKSTHGGARSFTTEAGGRDMDPLSTNGYFLNPGTMPTSVPEGTCKTTSSKKGFWKRGEPLTIIFDFR